MNSMRPSGSTEWPLQNRSFTVVSGCGTTRSWEAGSPFNVSGSRAVSAEAKNRQSFILWFVPDSPKRNSLAAFDCGSRSSTTCVPTTPRLSEAHHRPLVLRNAARDPGGGNLRQQHHESEDL